MEELKVKKHKNRGTKNAFKTSILKSKIYITRLF